MNLSRQLVNQEAKEKDYLTTLLLLSLFVANLLIIARDNDFSCVIILLLIIVIMPFELFIFDLIFLEVS